MSSHLNDLRAENQRLIESHRACLDALKTRLQRMIEEMERAVRAKDSPGFRPDEPWFRHRVTTWAEDLAAIRAASEGQ